MVRFCDGRWTDFVPTNGAYRRRPRGARRRRRWRNRDGWPRPFVYRLESRPKDFGYALAACNRSREKPYEPLARLRLFGRDADGVHWCGGWTSPRVDPADPNWTFSGELEALVTDVQGDTVSPHAGMELMFPLRIGDPMAISLARFVRTAPLGSNPAREYQMQALGSDIRFAYQADLGTFLITASSSADLQIPYAETWLAEPLRILFGQLTYPRLVARNLGHERAAVWIRRASPCWTQRIGPLSLQVKSQSTAMASFGASIEGY